MKHLLLSALVLTITATAMEKKPILQTPAQLSPDVVACPIGTLKPVERILHCPKRENSNTTLYALVSKCPKSISSLRKPVAPEPQ